MENKKITVAIDGYSSSGKSTMARRLAASVGYRYIDSGAMYRAVALYALEHGMIDAEGKPDSNAIASALPDIEIDFALQTDGSQHTVLDGKDVESEIRRLRVSEAVSSVAAIPAVRKALTAMQKQMGQGGGIVMDGRDIGTAVFQMPNLRFLSTPLPKRVPSVGSKKWWKRNSCHISGGAGQRGAPRSYRYHTCRESAQTSRQRHCA